MPDSSGSIDLGSLSQEEQEAVEKMAEEKGEEIPKVLTAFTVIVGYDGNPSVVEYDGDDLLVQSKPTQDLIKGACHNIIHDFNAFATAQASAQMTAQHLAQQAQAMQQQMMQQAEAQRLASSLNLPGGRR